MMPAPSGHRQIDLDVTYHRKFALILQDSALEIRSRLTIPKPGMKHTQASSIHGSELISANPLMSPELLKPDFGREAFFAKKFGCCVVNEPMSIGVAWRFGHAIDKRELR